MKRTLEQITWLDHCSYANSHWRDIEEYQELTPIEVKSVGYVVKETDEHIILLATISDQGQGFGDILILKGDIKKRKKLGRKL